MAGRTIWKGYIYFSGLHVPVKLHTSVRDLRIHFRLLHRPDGVKLKQQMVCAFEGVPVPREHQVKGFQVTEGRYVLVDPSELEEIHPDQDRMIEVLSFVRAREIDHRYYDRVYYLEPDRAYGAYAALRRVLEETGLVGICRWTMRRISYLGALKAAGRAIRLVTMRYADEVVPVASLNLPAVSVTERELRTGRELINSLSAPFDPGRYENEHQKRLWEMINRKAKGRKVVILRPRELIPTKDEELVEILEQSLKRVRHG